MAISVLTSTLQWRRHRQERVAVLFDAENIQLEMARFALEKAGQLGEVTVCRAYADWSHLDLTRSEWRTFAMDKGLTVVHTPAGTSGKNTADIALAIETVELLYSGAVHSFVIVSNDSDFRFLALRVREKGLPIYGVGHKQVKECLRSAYTEFFEFAEKKSRAAAKAAVQALPELAGRSKERRELRAAVGELPEELQRPVARLADVYLRLREEGSEPWVGGSILGQRLKDEYPDFVLPKGYGKQLSKFLKKYPAFFQVERQGTKFLVKVELRPQAE